jgi:hypothetical protein
MIGCYRGERWDSQALWEKRIRADVRPERHGHCCDHLSLAI